MRNCMDNTTFEVLLGDTLGDDDEKMTNDVVLEALKNRAGGKIQIQIQIQNGSLLKLVQKNS